MSEPGSGPLRPPIAVGQVPDPDSPDLGVGVELELHVVPVPGSLREGSDPQRGRRPSPDVEVSQVPQIGVQEHAPVDHQKRLAPDEIREGQQASRRPAGLRLLGVDDADPELSGTAQGVPVDVGTAVERQGSLADSASRQQSQEILHHGTVGHRQQRLGHRANQGHKVGVLTPRQDHRFHGRPPVRAARASDTRQAAPAAAS